MTEPAAGAGDLPAERKREMSKPKTLITGALSGCFAALLTHILLAVLPILLVAVILFVLYVIHKDLFWAGVYFLMYPAVLLYDRILLVCGLTIGLGLISGGLIGLVSPLPFFKKHPYLIGSLLSILVHILAGIAVGLYFAFGLQASALALPGGLYLTCLGPLVGILTVFVIQHIRRPAADAETSAPHPQQDDDPL